jgi:putative hydrolase of the HAD superfamily
VSPTIYRNIIFDLGNVLLKADLPGAIVRIAEQSNISAKEIAQFFAGADIIDRFDIGILSPDEFHSELIDALGWKGTSEQLRTIWEGMLSPDEEMISLLRRMKSLGYRTYILSNINPIHLKQMDRSFAFIRETDGALYSCECGMIKPDAKIFLHLFEAFGLVPHESIFIDDKEENVRTAYELGVYSIHHQSFNTTNEVLGRQISDSSNGSILDR